MKRTLEVTGEWGTNHSTEDSLPLVVVHILPHHLHIRLPQDFLFVHAVDKSRPLGLDKSGRVCQVFQHRVPNQNLYVVQPPSSSLKNLSSNRERAFALTIIFAQTPKATGQTVKQSWLPTTAGMNYPEAKQHKT